MVVTVPAPAVLNGRDLVEQLADDGMPNATVVLVGDRVEITAEGATQAKVSKVVAGHKPIARPAPVERLTDDELVRLRALLASR